MSKQVDSICEQLNNAGIGFKWLHSHL
jgi:hypothetical protein